MDVRFPIGVYEVTPSSGALTNVAARTLTTGIGVAGLCMYRSPASRKYYVFVGDSSGTLQQWELFDDGTGRVDARKVRTLTFGSTTEGCVADDLLGNLYVSEEDVAIWKYRAEPTAGANRVAVDRVGRFLRPDIEGPAIYSSGRRGGYLVASSQGSDSFAVYRRAGSNRHVANFVVGRGAIDGVTHTDGIDVTSRPLGGALAKGLFVAQDDHNDGGNQNFKLVPWGRISRATGLQSAARQAAVGRSSRGTGGTSYNRIERTLITHNAACIYVKIGAVGNKIMSSELRDNDRMSILTRSPTDDDAGAFGVSLHGDDTEIAYNTISGSDAFSYDYGRDGAAVEVYGGRRNRIHHNLAVDNDAFAELGNPRTADSTFAYNVIRSSLPTSVGLVTREARSRRGPVVGTRFYNNTVYLSGRASQGFVCHGGGGPAVVRAFPCARQAAEIARKGDGGLARRSDGRGGRAVAAHEALAITAAQQCLRTCLNQCSSGERWFSRSRWLSASSHSSQAQVRPGSGQLPILSTR